MISYLLGRQKAKTTKKILRKGQEFYNHKLGVLETAKTGEGEKDQQVTKIKYKRAAGSHQCDVGIRKCCTAFCQAKCLQEPPHLMWLPCWSSIYKKDELHLG